MVELQIESEYLERAARAAIEAGEHAARQIDSTEQERKSDSSIVTEADREAEEIIREALAETGVPILGEEFGGDVSEKDTYWLIDPIDGTQNYAYGQPLYGPSISFVDENDVLLGCFYMPETGDLYYAKSGEGAYRNSGQISVSDASNLKSAFVGVSGKKTGAVFSDISRDVGRLQKTYCAAQKGMYVGSGLLDACVYGPLYPWDFGTVVVVVREAGGVVARLESGASEWDAVSNGMFVAGNPELVEEIRGVLSEETVGVLADDSVLYG